MRNRNIQIGRSMIENFSTKFVNFATGLVVKCKNLRKVCRVELIGAEQNSLHRGNVLAFEFQKKSYFNSSCRSNNTQAGRSMIEMLGVLAIMAVITVLSIMAYTMAMRNVKVNQVKNDVYVMATQVRNLNPLGDYSKVGIAGKTTESDYITANLIDTGLLKSTKSPFGGAYFILKGSQEGGWANADVFTVAVRVDNPKDLKVLTAQDWSSADLNANGTHYMCYNDNGGGANDCNNPNFKGWIGFTFH